MGLDAVCSFFPVLLDQVPVLGLVIAGATDTKYSVLPPVAILINTRQFLHRSRPLFSFAAVLLSPPSQTVVLPAFGEGVVAVAVAVAMEGGGAQQVCCWYQVLPWATASPWMRSDKSGVAIPSVRSAQLRVQIQALPLFQHSHEAKGGVLLTDVTSTTAVPYPSADPITSSIGHQSSNIEHWDIDYRAPSLQPRGAKLRILSYGASRIATDELF